MMDFITGTISMSRRKGGVFHHPDSGASVYEVLFSSRIDGTAYAGVNRWDHQWTGKADLTFVSGPQYVLSSGDVVKASIVGNPPTIKAYINDVLIFTATDYSPLALKTGNPGMGFYSSSGCSGTAHNGDFGFTSLTAIAQENTATATETRLPNSPSILSIR